MKKSKKKSARKVADLRNKLEAYRSSALTVGAGPSRNRSFALTSAASGVAALAVAPAAEANIVHSGPQNIVLTSMGSTYPNVTYLNIDGDADIDFRANIVLGSLGGPIRTANFFRSSSSASVLNTISAPNRVKALSASYSVVSTPATGNWTSSGKLGKYAQIFPPATGQFPGAGPKFIGIQFDNAGQTHFGWVQVMVAPDVSMVTIVDWAWDDTPNTAIHAGSTSSGGAQVVPTLNEWGLMVLTGLLAGAAVLKGRKLTRTRTA